MSGAVYVALLIFALVSGSQLAFISVFSLITIVAIFEYLTISNPEGGKLVKLLDVIGAVLMFIGLPLSVFDNPLYILPFVGYVIVRQTVQLYIPQENALKSLSASLASQLYIALPLSLMSFTFHVFGWEVILAMFVMIWLNDTGAYCVGCTCGKHRLFERISPKKSWEGFFGGLLFTVLAGVAASLWLSDKFTTELAQFNMIEWILFGVLVTVFSTWGDLCESLLKRTAGVKDSGNIIPGHGGILDRIDSMLFVVPVTFIFCLIVAAL